ncbi:MAG: class I SAM-dependent methyltransferase [Niameybacter sp.]
MSIIRLLYKKISKKNKEEEALQCIEHIDVEKISEGCSTSFVQMMDIHNQKILEELSHLLHETFNEDKVCNVLDLIGGQGQNCSLIQKKGLEVQCTLIERSEALITSAKAVLGEGATYISRSSIQYLKVCPETSFDVVLCMWPNSQAPISTLIQEATRVLKPAGKLLIVTSLKDTFPEIIRLYHKLLMKHSNQVRAIKVESRYITSARHLERLCLKNNLKTKICKESRHIIGFGTPRSVINWLTKSKALSDYERLLPLTDKEVRKSLIELIGEAKVDWITHQFVYGIWEKI